MLFGNNMMVLQNLKENCTDAKKEGKCTQLQLYPIFLKFRLGIRVDTGVYCTDEANRM
jgi:hypothetical protein